MKDESHSVLDDLFVLAWRFVSKFPGLAGIAGGLLVVFAFFGELAFFGALSLTLLLLLVASRRGVGLVTVATLRSEETRRLRTVRTAIERTLERLHVHNEGIDIRRQAYGFQVEIRGDRPSLERVGPSLASALNMVAWRPEGSSHRGLTSFAFLQRDPLREPIEFQISDLDEERGLRFGVSEHGEDIWLDSDIQSLLISGTPGSGKSVVAAFVALAVFRREPVVAVDLKDGLEFSVFDDAPTAHVIKDPLEAISALTAANSEMKRRFALMRDEGVRHWKQVGGLKPLWIVVDEVQVLLAPSSKDMKSAMAPALGELLDLLRRGRAAGVVVVLATQFAKADVLPTELRDIVVGRFSLHQMNSSGYRMALGDTADEIEPIPPRQPGLGWLSTSHGVVRVRALHVKDEVLTGVVASAL